MERKVSINGLAAAGRARTPRLARYANKSVATALLLAGALVCVGCSGDRDSAPAKSGAKITASPNPVPAGTQKLGTTTITWDTGDGSIGEVYVSVNGAAEKLFAGKRAKGSLDAAWIGKGDHEFRLYAGKEHKTVLASVRVVKATK